MDTLVSEIEQVNRTFFTLGLRIRNLTAATTILAQTHCVNKPDVYISASGYTCIGTGHDKRTHYTYGSVATIIATIAAIIVCLVYKSDSVGYARGIRCILPNNYLVWEATRPISDCTYCHHHHNIVILRNVSEESFKPYAYSSRPVLMKGAALDWSAVAHFTLDYFHQLYAQHSDEDVCQFLHFKSTFDTLSGVFAAANRPGRPSWYVGWGNCQPDVLAAMRRHYPARPPFLPLDSELPTRDYVFMGFGVGAEGEGATMHIDFIGRLMWQAQLRGSKRWRLLPINECERACAGELVFTAEAGDVVLVDTRLWYHATSVPAHDHFSISVQSEYG